MTFRTEVCVSVLALGTILAGPAKAAAKTEQEPKYDPAAVIDFGAVVVEVKEVAKENSLSGLLLVVKNDSDVTMNVYLGPADFIKGFDVTFRKGDNIHVSGSKIKLGGDTVVLAREVRRDSATLYFRDRNGAPYWTMMGKPSS